MTWRLYYTDRSRVTSEDGSWAEAPAWGVGVLAVPNADSGVALPTGDFYIWPEHTDAPYAADAWGLMDMLLVRGVMTTEQALTEVTPKMLVEVGVKLGRSLDHDAWRDLWNWVVEDTADWNGGKNAYHRWERVPSDT